MTNTQHCFQKCNTPAMKKKTLDSNKMRARMDVKFDMVNAVRRWNHVYPADIMIL